MGKRKHRTKKQSGIKSMKLIAIKKECFALSEVSCTSELKKRYATLCKKRDFRKRKTWEYVLKRLRTDGDWIGIRVSDINHTGIRGISARSTFRTLTISPERIAMDKAADNDD